MVEVKLNTKYRFLCLETGTYLTRSTEDGHSIVGHAFTDDAKGQEWVFQSSGDSNDYTIKAADTNQYLAVPADGVSGGQQLQCIRIPSIWNVWDVENMAAVVRITPMVDEGYNIDVFEGRRANGTKIQLWQRTGHNQLWVLEEVNKD